MDKNHAIIEAEAGVNHAGGPAMAKVLVSVALAIPMRWYGMMWLASAQNEVLMKMILLNCRKVEC